MNHELMPAARTFVAAVAVLAGVLLAGPSPALANSVREAAAHAKVRLIVAASQRGVAFAARDKALRPGTCALSTAYVAAAGAQPVQRANKSRLRPAQQLGLQRLARRGGKQAGPASAKPASPEVVDHLRQVMRLLRRDEARAGRSVSAAAQRAIAAVEASPGIQVGGLAKDLGIHQSTASNLVEKLSREGFVTKRRTVEDHRTVKLFATARGRTVLRTAPAQGPDRLQEALAKLPASTLAALGEHLRALREQLQPEGVRQA